MIESVGEPAQPNPEKPEPSSEESRREVRHVGEGYAECLAHWSEGWTVLLGQEPNAAPRISGWMTRCSGRRTHC
jgi:hypothetical protein